MAEATEYEFKELYEYEWGQELVEMRRTGIHNLAKGTGEFRPGPIDLVFTMMNEVLKYPEVCEAMMANLTLNEPDTLRLSATIYYFEQYIAHKYGCETSAWSAASIFLRHLLRGKYEGIEDPKLRKDLLKQNFVCA